MESWLQRTILNSQSLKQTNFKGLLAVLNFVLVISACALVSVHANAQEEDEQLLEDIIQPDIERREIDEDKIDTENFEVGLYRGVISIEDFGTSDIYGIKLAYHISEDFFLEYNYGYAQAQETSFEILNGATPLLTDNERDYTSYYLDLGINIFPGEIYIGKWAFNSSFYLIGGAGNTLFADNEYFTYNFGAGLRLFMTDWVALHFDFRNYVFTHNIFGGDKKAQNLEGSLGLTLYL